MNGYSLEKSYKTAVRAMQEFKLDLAVFFLLECDKLSSMGIKQFFFTIKPSSADNESETMGDMIIDHRSVHLDESQLKNIQTIGRQIINISRLHLLASETLFNEIYALSEPLKEELKSSLQNSRVFRLDSSTLERLVDQVAPSLYSIDAKPQQIIKSRFEAIKQRSLLSNAIRAKGGAHSLGNRV